MSAWHSSAELRWLYFNFSWLNIKWIKDAFSRCRLPLSVFSLRRPPSCWHCPLEANQSPWQRRWMPGKLWCPPAWRPAAHQGTCHQPERGWGKWGTVAGTWNGPSVCFAAGWMPLELCWVPETVAGGCAQRHWQRGGLAGKAEHRALSCPGGRSDANACVILALAFVIALGQWGGVAMWLL